jgi:HD-like signal output (HDOD) protein
MESDNSTFHDAENELSGGMVSHEFIGELLLQKSNMPPELVAAVGLHHATGETPPPLVALIHVANNITKEIGLGYIEDEPVQYTDGAFKALKIGPQIIRHLKAVMSEEVVAQVKQLVRQCMS